MKPIGIYAGSFDPITNGHLDVLRGSLKIADRVIVAIGIHPGKQPLFSFVERKDLIHAVANDEFKCDAKRIEVIAFDNLVVDKARELDASLLIRGLRDGSDLDYEMQLAGMNATMSPDIQTVFLPASISVRAITATLVRQIASMGGNVSHFVPEIVAHALKNKFQP
ncbi:pantetheine-phosphate adenylyltransferase [Bartonella sp. HY329]|uniref:pantetheine-phosphate adenylyltransferase n=1 Tax=unclassified Bartonella TaxID=2645622 RepID=UPI0021C7EDD2|nr:MULTISPECIES: pantetheine-phosphate adenylyltransferase [unclassified Bartonella]UXM95944.1 pantetheine-phosphate adenylyltransferase [Bartonella sp. HY329]UXN10269.1 pantetheine-phosphate adenylyltransferase [Bartonella sp. HY328]